MRLPVEKFLPLAALTLLASCAGEVRSESVAQVPVIGPAADYPMVVGDPFVVDGATYTPVDKMNYDAVGHAVVGAEGGTTVSAAHRTLPLPSYVEVTALDSGKTVLVRVERRGPMSGRGLIELSPGAATQLGLTGSGYDPIRVRRVNPVEQDRAALRSGAAAPLRMDTPKSLLTVLMRKLDLQDGVVRPEVSPAPDATAATDLPPKPEPKGKGKPIPKAPVVAQTSAPAKSKPPAAKTPVAAEGEPAVKPAPVVSTRSGHYFVQVGAFSSKANADGSARKVGGTSSQSGKLWRVRTGPFASEADAKAALAKAKGAGYSDARIQRAD